MGKHIYLNKQIEEKIDKLAEQQGFNFSAWVQDKFTDEFLSEENCLQQIKQLEEKLTSEKKRLELIRSMPQQIKVFLKPQEIEFLKEVKREYQENENLTWEQACKMFNIRFKKGFTVELFKNCIRQKAGYEPDEIRKKKYEF